MRKFFALLAVSVCLLGCPQDPDVKLARKFLDAYYVMANHEQALALAEGQAKEQLLQERELLKNVPPSEEVNAYKSRDITFKLQRRIKTEQDATLLYELKIIHPDLPDQTQLISMTVDLATNKIKAYSLIGSSVTTP